MRVEAMEDDKSDHSLRPDPPVNFVDAWDLDAINEIEDDEIREAQQNFVRQM